MDMGISNMLNTQLAYCIVNGSYIPVAAMLDTEIKAENCYKQDRKLTKTKGWVRKNELYLTDSSLYLWKEQELLKKYDPP